MTRIQTALGKNAKARLSTDSCDVSDVAAGQIVVDAVQAWIGRYIKEIDGSELTTSIYSENLRTAANLSAYNARLAYLLGKATILKSYQRKCIVRTQIIEYGAVCEAILLDLIQSIGKNDRPRRKRPMADARGGTIDWSRDGLLHSGMDARFSWLINLAAKIDRTLFGGTMKTRLHELRELRNLIHSATAKRERYTADLDAAKIARAIAVDLRDSCVQFKQKHQLP